jgi:hypothetical protein
MNVNLQMMDNNMMYFNEWVKHNESWRGKLQIIGNNLVYQGNGNQDAIDISNYYLPQILENPLLREQIQMKNHLQAEDIFRVIRVNVLASEESDVVDEQAYIADVVMEQDDMEQYFLVVEDNLGHKFKITQNIELILQTYQKLRNKNTNILLEDFKKEMEGLWHE